MVVTTVSTVSGLEMFLPLHSEHGRLPLCSDSGHKTVIAWKWCVRAALCADDAASPAFERSASCRAKAFAFRDWL